MSSQQEDERRRSLPGGYQVAQYPQNIFERLIFGYIDFAQSFVPPGPTPPFLGPIDPLINSYVQQNGKFQKSQVVYAPKNVNPVPVAWVYQCASCRRFLPPNRCSVVSEAGPPDPGEINPLGWCDLWENRPDDPIFEWLRRRILGFPDPWEIRPTSPP